MQNNLIQGIAEIQITAKDIQSSRQFFLDLGLKEKLEFTFFALNGSRIQINEGANFSINTLTWNVKANINDFYQRYKNRLELSNKISQNGTIECRDPSGLLLIFKEDQIKSIDDSAVMVNGLNSTNRVNSPVPEYDKITPIEISHIVLETDDIESSEKFYKNLGFIVSDRLVGRGVFLRDSIIGGHHDIFLIQSDKNRLHHIAFAVKDIYELFSGGKIMESKGWKTAKGPGLHRVSSAFFWYFYSPLEFMIEYTVNEDRLTEDWIPREISARPDLSTESFVQR